MKDPQLKNLIVKVTVGLMCMGLASNTFAQKKLLCKGIQYECKWKDDRFELSVSYGDSEDFRQKVFLSPKSMQCLIFTLNSDLACDGYIRTLESTNDREVLSSIQNCSLRVNN